jgi:hypothetical protein
LLGNGGYGGAGGLGNDPLLPLGYGGTGGHGGMIWGNQGFSGAGWDGKTISMPTVQTTEPIVNLSVNGQTSGPILVDTGSAGLVMQIKDIGGLPGLLKLGIPHGLNISAYSGGLTYLYASYPTSVDFGNGIVSSPTAVNVVLFSLPTSTRISRPPAWTACWAWARTRSAQARTFRPRLCRARWPRACRST